MAQYVTPPLTTIRQDAFRIGKLAAEIVVNRIEGREQPNRTILPPKLIVRESCGINLGGKGNSITLKSIKAS
jgi:LacI family transcriptional regulator